MHDDPLERRLRPALREDAASLPFTITVEELQRRLTLRRRAGADRRVTLLLAAAIGVGLLGLGGLVGGLIDRATIPPTDATVHPSPTARVSPEPTQVANPVTLPDLEELVGNEGRVLLAQAHGPAEGPMLVDAYVPLGAQSADLGTVAVGASDTLDLGCLGADSISLTVTRVVDRGATPGQVTPVPCRGTFRTLQFGAAGRYAIALASPSPTSWRLVVHGTPSAPSAPDLPALAAPAGDETLAEAQSARVEPSAPTWGPGGTSIQEIRGLPGRLLYRVQAACRDGSAIRFVLGWQELDGTITADSQTWVPCDGEAHATELRIPDPFGTTLFVAAGPEVTWSILASSTEPPIAAAEGEPGWAENVAFGPAIVLDPEPQTVSMPGTNLGGPVRVVIACAGTSEPIDVSVEVGATDGEQVESFAASCTPAGAETRRTFNVRQSNVHVTYDAPVGTWIVISVLIPAGSP